MARQEALLGTPRHVEQAGIQKEMGAKAAVVCGELPRRAARDRGVAQAEQDGAKAYPRYFRVNIAWPALPYHADQAGVPACTIFSDLRLRLRPRVGSRRSTASRKSGRPSSPGNRSTSWRRVS